MVHISDVWLHLCRSSALHNVATNLTDYTGFWNEMLADVVFAVFVVHMWKWRIMHIWGLSYMNSSSLTTFQILLQICQLLMPRPLGKKPSDVFFFLFPPCCSPHLLSPLNSWHLNSIVKTVIQLNSASLCCNSPRLSHIQRCSHVVPSGSAESH